MYIVTIILLHHNSILYFKLHYVYIRYIYHLDERLLHHSPVP